MALQRKPYDSAAYFDLRLVLGQPEKEVFFGALLTGAAVSWAVMGFVQVGFVLRQFSR
jgi:hypothetical protein